MKQIIAVIKPYLAEKVIQAVAGQPVDEISIREVKGYGRQKGYLDRYSENEYSLAFVPKVEISIWLDDKHAESVAQKIIEVSRTGRLGDGKIMILPVDGYSTVGAFLDDGDEAAGQGGSNVEH